MAGHESGISLQAEDQGIKENDRDDDPFDPAGFNKFGGAETPCGDMGTGKKLQVIFTGHNGGCATSAKTFRAQASLSEAGGFVFDRVKKCSREDSNLHRLPYTLLRRTRLPVPPRERGAEKFAQQVGVAKHDLWGFLRIAAKKVGWSSVSRSCLMLGAVLSGWRNDH